MDRKLMEQMFYEGVMPREQCCPRKKEYHDTMKLCNTVEVEFSSHLSLELAQMFQDYKDYSAQLAAWKMGSILFGDGNGDTPDSGGIYSGR